MLMKCFLIVLKILTFLSALSVFTMFSMNTLNQIMNHSSFIIPLPKNATKLKFQVKAHLRKVCSLICKSVHKLRALLPHAQWCPYMIARLHGSIAGDLERDKSL